MRAGITMLGKNIETKTEEEINEIGTKLSEPVRRSPARANKSSLILLWKKKKKRKQKDRCFRAWR